MSRTIKYLVIFAWVFCADTDRTYAGSDECQDQTGFSVWSPRKHQPVFAQPGQSIAVEIEASSALPADGWQATLGNDFNTWESPGVIAEYGRIDHDTRDGWRLTIQLPADTPPELMVLNVFTPSGQHLSSPRSVQLVLDLEQDFYILHQSDQHLTEGEAGAPDGTATERRYSGGTKEALQWLAPVVNLINPRMVLQMGDNMQIYNTADDWCGMEEAKLRVDRFFEGLDGFAVPTVLTTGNHDIGWRDYVEVDSWRKHYTNQVGQRAFSFRMGSMYVMSYEWTSDAYLDWTRKDYAQSWNDPSVNYRLLITHYYNGLHAWTNVATEEQPCDLLLVGHIHRTRVLQTEPYTVLSVGSAQDYQRAAFFDFKRTDSGWLSEEAATHADNVNVHRLLGDYGEPMVSASYEQENDGSAAANVVRISNKLPHDFYDGRIRFVMKKGRYGVAGGETLAHYDSADGRQTVVLVKVDISAQDETEVAINEL